MQSSVKTVSLPSPYFGACKTRGLIESVDIRRWFQPVFAGRENGFVQWDKSFRGSLTTKPHHKIARHSGMLNGEIWTALRRGRTVSVRSFDASFACPCRKPSPAVMSSTLASTSCFSLASRSAVPASWCRSVAVSLDTSSSGLARSKSVGPVNYSIISRKQLKEQSLISAGEIRQNEPNPDCIAKSDT
jgi:hypothetical protein